MKKIFLPIISSLFLTGCFSKLSIKPVYPFEGRYNDKTDLTIDGQKVDIPKGKSIWILSNDTLYNVLDNAKGK